MQVAGNTTKTKSYIALCGLPMLPARYTPLWRMPLTLLAECKISERETYCFCDIIAMVQEAAQGAVLSASDDRCCLKRRGGLQQLDAVYLAPVVERMNGLNRLPSLSITCAPQPHIVTTLTKASLPYHAHGGLSKAQHMYIMLMNVST